MASRFPAVFMGHGSPTFLLAESKGTRSLKALASLLPRPKAILCISAHWETRSWEVTGSSAPPIIYDFGGFPRACYQVTYPAPGDPDLAQRVAKLTGANIDPKRGFDHGSWVPLRFMYPDASIPVLQLSVKHGGSAAEHYALGQKLAPLRDEGVLIIGGGALFHSFPYFGEMMSRGHDMNDIFDGDVDAWVEEYLTWMDQKLSDLPGSLADLLEYRTRCPHAVRAHPTDEHLMPMFVALGAAESSVGQKVANGTKLMPHYLFQ
eukprot:TRINITY_DN15019_c0_g1_i1.p1 TRINITY_DN15019_c0_g1~~TRINITY_DN15019_c0_g1_i1.p1  ORF type:complete len:263 (+),score=35.04 TRINITY_DN15019_c0_g1_i1:64-852(+)